MINVLNSIELPKKAFGTICDDALTVMCHKTKTQLGVNRNRFHTIASKHTTIRPTELNYSFSINELFIYISCHIIGQKYLLNN